MDRDPLHRRNDSAERHHSHKAPRLSSHMASRLLRSCRTIDVYGRPTILNARSKLPILADPPKTSDDTGAAVASRPTAVGRLRPLWRITFSSTFIYLGALQSIVA